MAVAIGYIKDFRSFRYERHESHSNHDRSIEVTDRWPTRYRGLDVAPEGYNDAWIRHTCDCNGRDSFWCVAADSDVSELHENRWRR